MIGVLATMLAARPAARRVEMRGIDEPHTIYQVWCGRHPIGSVWRQSNGRWCALSYSEGRMKLAFGTALQAAWWLAR